MKLDCCQTLKVVVDVGLFDFRCQELAWRVGQVRQVARCQS
jgi:hypothetical protein